ncbi:MAG: NUDIX hydrolase [Oscillospiraceae bacterium]|nr:NUDIX hydrolase [Oscillospiraceae bacterium]
MKLYEERIGSEVIYEGKVFNVRRDAVLLPDGRETVREIVEHSGGAAVLALTDDMRVPMVRQYRHGARRVLLEIPAGKIERGEQPLICGVRELREECGYTAESVEPLGTIIPTGAYCREVIYLFLARGLSPAESAPDDEEFLEVEHVAFADALDMAADGRITDAKTVAALFMASRRMDAARAL